MTDIDTEQTVEEQDEAPLAPGAAQAPGGGPSEVVDIQTEVVEGEVVRDGAEEAAVGAEDDLAELALAAAKRDEYLALAQRTQADFENYRKRVARDAALAAER